MVYDIDYVKDNERYTLFDIVIWLKPKEVDYKNGKWIADDRWNSEIQKSVNSRWIAKFVFEQIHDEDTLNEFIKDCKKLDWLRGYLHEEHRNYLLPKDEASNMLYHNHLPDIKKIIFDFAEKWKLSINED